MTESVKKLINKDVYEKNADSPWAKFKDFIFTDDTKAIRYAVLSTISLIPILYVVEFDAFESISKVAVLKEGVKPLAIKPHYDEPKSFEKIKKKKMLSAGRRLRIRDVYFDTEIGEITDFVTAGMLPGRKQFFSPEDAGFFLDDLLRGG